jgi:ligand-binding sensor domain-containing protein/signal transduction histidine kinase
MRNQIYWLVIVFCLLQIACERKKRSQDSFGFKTPTVVEAKGHKVSKEKMAPPKVIAATGVKKIPVGKPEIIKLTSNVFPAQPVSVTQAGASPKDTLGKDGYQLPVSIAAKDSPFMAGVPEIVVVDKDFYSKDENPESFSSISVAHGLKYDEVNALCKDRVGNLWIGTWDGGGVSKYDGRTLTNYSVGQGLSSEHAFSLMEDRDGNMWIGTDHCNINKFDGKFITRYDVGFGMSNNFVLDMMQDRNGSIWFATPNGVIRYDGNFFTHYTTSQGLTVNGTSCIFEDSKGNIWAGTDGGICKFDGRVFQNYNNVFNLWKDVEFTGEVKSIFEDKSGNLWIGTNNDGLYQQNGNLISHFTAQTGLSSNYISSLAEDQKGNIWIATYDSGLNKFDGKSFTHYGSEQGLTSESIYTLLIDRSGTLWLGTGAGINKYDGGLFSHVQAIQGRNKETIVCMNADKNKNFWIGGWANLKKYDGASITRFTPSQGLQNLPVTDILEDTSGNIWFANWMGGVNKFDGTWFTQYSISNGLIDNEVIDILEDKKGDIWIGTNGGVSKFDGKDFTNYSSANGLISDDINSLFEDHEGNLWFGTRDKGLSEFDGSSFTNYNITNGLGGAAITCIAEDKKNNLWLGTNDGLLKFDGKNFIHYTAEQGLNGSIVTNILSAKNGEIWIGTNHGLNRFDANGDTTNTDKSSFSLFKKYTTSEGFLGVWSYYKTMVEDTSGDIWIGAQDRLTKCHPEADISDTIPPTIQLSSLALFDEEIKWQDVEKKKDSTIILNNGARLKNFSFSGLSPWYNQPQNLELAYNNNYITFHFIGITTNRPKEVRYQYFLAGLDKNWSIITDRPEATYNNLPPGKYTFKVKAANSEGYWSNELNYPLIILPPWWSTWWAYTLYALVFLIALIVFIKWRERILKKEKILLEEKVSLRTQELQKEKEKVESSLEQVKALQAQLVETEKINERLRISQELHDDIGGTLSGIVLYSHLAENQIQSQHIDEVERSLNMIQQSANNMVNKLSDIIWSVNPEHNSIKNLFQKLKVYAAEMGAAKNIKVQVDSPEYLAELPLPVSIRHNMYLLFKEAINNAVKYSEASLLQLSIHHSDHDVEFAISDNGKGFDITTVKAGNGLMNMQKRANDIHAKLCLKSIPQQGTVVSLQCSVEVPS